MDEKEITPTITILSSLFYCSLGFEPYKKESFSQIEGMSDFHKLNWKAKKPHGVQNTNYDYVLSL